MKLSRFSEPQILAILRQAKWWCPCARALPGTRDEHSAFTNGDTNTAVLTPRCSAR